MGIHQNLSPFFHVAGTADLSRVHLTQIQRYEAGTAQPTPDVMKKLAALTASTDWLLFEEDERGPDDELKLQFEALRQFDEEERKTALEVLDGLILKHQAKRMVQRTQSQAATRSTAKAAQGSK
ncbi:MAG: helix-turn-helix transcriptional regulator [Gammaproteobacteria bacterium]|nr:helix-turn-helix transcriptional regulator [Gammaproteobacteria bacterium]